ncbi:Oligosaccaryltransferase-domain-containing protein [Dactylonectria estremocensis]|uniref:Dolichyl-diphosphooligosaccharide--protein glycosyltransferase subunit 4 n=1 Tax=Dactylonectria estremocensis TaxID=1079267 RepID=A0A9P9ECQ3_9HYPO|nr:Oligosaccaryltransferase-domain-containing protein [Dactylonectria estremocensis]
MISDADLYRLAIFLGSSSMVLIVLYHFLEVNSSDAAQKVEGAHDAPIKKQVAN